MNLGMQSAKASTCESVALFSTLLLLGLLGAQWFPLLLGASYAPARQPVVALTMIALAFIMIDVGYEFALDDKCWRFRWKIPSKPPTSPTRFQHSS